MPNKNKNKRLKLLSAAEIDSIFGLPAFDNDERELYFTLTSAEKLLADSFSTVSHRVHFILLLGFCKAKNKLFKLTNNVSYEDIQYIYDKYFPDSHRYRRFNLPRGILRNQHKMIMRLLELKPYHGKMTDILTDKAIKFAPISMEPVSILQELLQYLEDQSILMPGYTALQDIVSDAVLTERKRLQTIYQQYTDHEFDQQLADVIVSHNKNPSLLNYVINDPKDFKTKCMQNEIKKLQRLKPLYEKSKALIPALQTSQGNISYYASLVDYYPPWQLKRLEYQSWKIYLLCYVNQRYRQLNQNLVSALFYHVNKDVSSAKQYVKNKVDFLDLNQPQNKNAFYQAMKYYIDKSVSDNLRFSTVRKKLFKQFPRKQFSKIITKMSHELKSELYYEWEYYQNKANKFKRNIRPLLQHLNFYGDEKYDNLLKAIDTLKTAIDENKPLSQIPLRELPKAFIPKYYKPYIYEYKQSESRLQSFEIATLNVDRYEFLIYKMLSKAVQDYEISVEDTLQFTPLEDDLVDIEALDVATLESLNDMIDLDNIRSSPDKILDEIVSELESNYKIVNENIATGKNKHINIKPDGTWTLPYESIDKLPENPIFENFPKKHMLDIMKFVNDEIQFTKCFTHILNSHIKNERDDDILQGCIYARACNLGIKSMASLSDLPYSTLKKQDAAFVRLQTLRECNDYIVECTTKLPMYKNYYIEEGIIYSSSDGTKTETTKHTTRSRYSKKYFGMNKGISVYFLNANHLSINANIIGANESESPYVHDFLFNNTSCIKPHVHCTDTDGANPVNFFILHFFKRKYAPRYRNIYNKAQQLYGTKPLSSYKNLLIKPKYKADLSLIKKHWGGIINILASLGSKKINQQTLVHKLSKRGVAREVKEAIWMLNGLLMSNHILQYINDMSYRQCIQKSLNRGELSHKLFKAIRCYHKGKINAKNDAEQVINNECTRLIANIIVYFNTLIMSKVVDVKESSKQQEDADKIKGFTPSSWTHVLFEGYFHVRTRKNNINLEKIISALSKLKIKDVEGKEKIAKNLASEEC